MENHELILTKSLKEKGWAVSYLLTVVSPTERQACMPPR